MKSVTAIALLALLTACEQTTEPCSENTDKPVLEIAAATNQATGSPIRAISIENITLNGAPLDSSTLRNDYRWNVVRTDAGLSCTLPCLFGAEEGSYAFDVRAPSFYGSSAQVAATY